MVLFLKNLAFTIVAPGTAAFLIPWLMVGGRRTELGFMTMVSILLFVAGSAIYLWCVWDFATFGRGTPAPIDAPKKLVTRGLYRYSRNPMYIGVLSVILGEALWLESGLLLLYMAFVFTAFNTFIRVYEEPTLRRSYGEEYERYCESTPRWRPRISVKKAEAKED